MRYCSRCGQPVELRIPAGEDRERHVCSACGVIHYQNPRMVVGCIVEHEGRVLMCKRAIEPRRGYWTVPAGYLELGESAAQGAVRETHEEAGADVRIVAPFAHFDVPHIGQAYILYRAELLSRAFGPGPESLEVELTAPNAIPFEQLAFPVVRHSLRLLLEDRAAGRYRMHTGSLVRERAREQPGGSFELCDHLALPLG